MSVTLLTVQSSLFYMFLYEFVFVIFHIEHFLSWLCCIFKFSVNVVFDVPIWLYCVFYDIWNFLYYVISRCVAKLLASMFFCCEKFDISVYNHIECQLSPKVLPRILVTPTRLYIIFCNNVKTLFLIFSIKLYVSRLFIIFTHFHLIFKHVIHFDVNVSQKKLWGIWSIL